MPAVHGNRHVMLGLPVCVGLPSRLPRPVAVLVSVLPAVLAAVAVGHAERARVVAVTARSRPP
jgi:hypothetical protein